MKPTLHMPITTAARKGVAALVTEAEQQRVILTSGGHPVAVVDSAERIDEDLRTVREAARAVTEAAAKMALGRTEMLDLDDVCIRLGLNAAHVRARATKLRGG